jgi:hypothetical protein
VKSSLITRLKRLESKVQPNENLLSSYKFTFEDWNLEEIKAALFMNPTSSVIEKWNLTNWGDHRVYLQHLSVKELKKLEKMVINGELWCGA